MRLFVARAGLVRPGFALTPENAGTVAEVCRRLDGLPLALELAAARLRVLSPTELAAQLRDRFAVLTGGARTVLPRHQSLRAAVDWSYGLLTGPERALLDRLAVFAGGFTRAAAQAVAADVEDAEGGSAEERIEPRPDRVAPGAVLDLLTALVDKSLVHVVDPGTAGPGADGQAGSAPETRYGLLETLREYALERLQEHGELAAARTRHAGYYLALTEAAAPELKGPRQLAWLGRLEVELDNLRQALRWCQTERASAETGLRLAAALRHFWQFRGRHREGRAWLEAALARPGAAARTEARAAALCVAGLLALALGDHAAARARLEASVALWRELGDARGLGRALAQLGYLTTARDATAARALLEEAVALARAAGDRPDLALALRFLGNLEAPRPVAAAGPAPSEESAALFRELGDAWGLGVALTGLGARALRSGDEAAAHAYLAEALARRREADDRMGVALILIELGALARRRGDHRQAARLGEEARGMAQNLGSTEMAAGALIELGHLALAAGDPTRARTHFAESLRLSREHESVRGQVRTLAGLTAVAAALGQSRRALRLGGAVAAAGTTTGRPLLPADQAALDGGLALARQALPAEEQAAAWAEGRAMPLAAAVEDALTLVRPVGAELANRVAGVGPARTGPRRTPRRAAHDGRAAAGDLTRREREVAAQVARGCTNRQIAQALGISPRTAENHVKRILAKLGARSRARIAAWAAARGLAGNEARPLGR